MGKGGASGFVNAVLRKFSQGQIPMPTQEDFMLSVKYSYPLFALRKLLEYYPLQEVEKIIGYDKENTCVRFSEDANLQEYKSKYELNETPFKNVYFIPNFKMEDGFYLGEYTFQSIGSVAICDIAKGEGKLLDCCSAPGGKSVNLARFYSSVTSLDIHEHRVELVKSYASRMGVKVDTMVWDSTIENPNFLNGFDTVLCDVPCSGLGVIKDNPDIKLNRTEDNIKELKITQSKILSTCSKYVKIGGKLVYSTCSILPEENQENIKEFLSKNNNFVLEEIDSKLQGVKNTGITFLPHVSMGAGFYVCVLRRIK